ncbi:alpha-2 adrenergic receptor [Trichonephila clavipes]|nr:alpha-2 adrenergic receptor [Trichonephila clavipes]
MSRCFDIHLWIRFTPNAAVLFVDVAIQPEVRFIAKQNSFMKIGNNGNLVLGPFDESTPCLMIVLMNCQTKLRINHLTAVKSVAILESNANLNFYTWKKNTLYIIASSHRKISQRLPGIEPLLGKKGIVSYRDLLTINEIKYATFQEAARAAGLSNYENFNNEVLDDAAASVMNIRFVEWAQNEIAVVPDFHKRILFSDEAHFWLNGYVNKQNCHIWSEANPQVYVETLLHPEKLTVWCALWAGGILLQKR